MNVIQEQEPMHALVLRLPVSLRRGLGEVARVHDRSVSGEIRVAIRAHLERAGVVTDEPKEDS